MNDANLKKTERLLPFNSSELEQALEQVQAQRLTSIPVPLSNLWNPEQCPEPLLPWLAWALSVENWEHDWDTEIKRAVIAESVQVHRQKGTLASIRRVLEAIRVRFEVEEWFQYEGEPYTFRLTTSANEHFEQGLPVADPETFTTLRKVVDSVKPVRSHYQILVKVESETELSAANSSSVITVLKSEVAPLFMTSLRASVGLATSVMTTRTHLRCRVESVLPSFDEPINSVGRLRTVSVLQRQMSLIKTSLNASLTISSMNRLSVISVLRQR